MYAQYNHLDEWMPLTDFKGIDWFQFWTDFCMKCSTIYSRFERERNFFNEDNSQIWRNINDITKSTEFFFTYLHIKLKKRNATKCGTYKFKHCFWLFMLHFKYTHWVSLLINWCFLLHNETHSLAVLTEKSFYLHEFISDILGWLFTLSA